MGDLRKKTNSSQFEKLVELMQQNPDIAKGLGAFGSSKKSQKEYWERFAIDLNSLGPPSREGKEWHKVWLDYKLKLKKKISANKKEIVATGGGQYTPLSLSPLEQAVDNLLSLQHAVNPSGCIFGGRNTQGSPAVAPSSINATERMEEAILQELLDSNNEDAEVQDEDAQDVQRRSSSGQQRSLPARKRGENASTEKENARMKLLKDQTDTQLEILTISKSIDKSLAEIARYSRKSFELEKEKINLLKAKEKRKEKENLDKNKRHIETVELKIKKLDIELRKLNNI